MFPWVWLSGLHQRGHLKDGDAAIVSPRSPSDSFCPLARWLPTVFDHHALPQALTLILSLTLYPPPPHISLPVILPLFPSLRCCFYVLEEVMTICLSCVCHSVLSHSLIHSFFFFFWYLSSIPLTVGFKILFYLYLNDILSHFGRNLRNLFYQAARVAWGSLAAPFLAVRQSNQAIKMSEH